MTRAVLEFGGRVSGGKSIRAEIAMREALRDGGRVLLAEKGQRFVMSLADDNFTLVRTPLPPAPAAPIWFDELEQDR